MAFIKKILNGFLGLKKDPNATTQDTAVIKSEDTNAGIAIVPNGTGAITAQVPDGTVAGGNARGANAVDLQMTRNSVDQVASGIGSCVLGGYKNKASGQYSIAFGENNQATDVGAIAIGLGNTATARGSVAIGGYNAGNDSTGVGSSITGGESNIASSTYSTISGGQSNTASTNNYATVVGGQSNTSSGQYSISGGNGNTASGQYSISIGRGNIASGLGSVAIGGGYASSEATASGAESFAMGQGATATNVQSFAFGSLQNAYLHHGFVHGFTRFGTGQGQYQDTTVQVQGALTTGGTVDLLKDTAYPLQGSGLIPDGNNRAWNVTVKWVAVVTSITGTATGVSVGDIITQVNTLGFKRVGGTSSVVGSVNTISTNNDTSMATASMGYTAGGSQQLALTFTAPTFTGGGSVTCRVVAKVELTEVAY